ncbi:MAG TPA: ribonuclease P protein subunit [Candidatus Thermoplasmatota archaeon]|nr:ribonuclease P protein subunit [Candidatus Thermoplasmatota archaeon]
MKRENADVARHELIGLFVTVESPSGALDGLEGTVRDETKQTFLVERASGSEAVVPKPGNRFVFLVGNERFVVRGEDILFRPEDRTKKVRM